MGVNVLAPRFKWQTLPHMLLLAACGSVIAGTYGIVHDQMTFSIGPEYFTTFKFEQFGWADKRKSWGVSDRFFVGTIGFLATWWVGMFTGWFLGRIALPGWPRATAYRMCFLGFAMVFALGILGGIAGWLWGHYHGPDYGRWHDIAEQMGIKDLRSFKTVGFIHNGSYIGGGLGLLLSSGLILWWRIHYQQAQANQDSNGTQAAGTEIGQ